MNKPTKKRNKFNEEVLEALELSYGFSIDYIRKCIRGDRTGIMPDKIITDYKKLDKEHQIINAKAKKALIEKAENLN